MNRNKIIISSTLFCFIIMCFTFPSTLQFHYSSKEERLSPKISFIDVDIDDDDPSKDWAYTASTYAWCTGAGIISNPYIIEGINITGSIINSDKYFMIQNCFGGCDFRNVMNGIIYDNIAILDFEDCSQNIVINNNLISNYGAGVTLENCNFTLIKNNIFNNISDITISSERVIYLAYSHHNNISGNYVMNCRDPPRGSGIWLWQSTYNNISYNTIENMYWCGINLEGSDYNIITYNTIRDVGRCIRKYGSEGTIIKHNKCKDSYNRIYGFNFLIILFSFVTVSLITFYKRLNLNSLN